VVTTRDGSTGSSSRSTLGSLSQGSTTLSGLGSSRGMRSAHSVVSRIGKQTAVSVVVTIGDTNRMRSCVVDEHML
jgi:hypothetical protein